MIDCICVTRRNANTGRRARWGSGGRAPGCSKPKAVPQSDRLRRPRQARRAIERNVTLPQPNNPTTQETTIAVHVTAGTTFDVSSGHSRAQGGAEA
jgi:hypothetical protein